MNATAGQAPAYSLIIPVYRNEGNLARLLPAIASLNEQLSGRLEAVFVVDGSPDASYARLREQLPSCGFRSVLVNLSRNFGSFAAIRRGLAAGAGDYMAVMAADLQEPPELILKFFQALDHDIADVAIGVRQKRDDPLHTQWSSRLYWSIYKRLVQPQMPAGGIDVFGCNRKVRDALLSLEERNSSLVGLLLWVGFRRLEVPYDRQARQEGKSGWTLRKRIRYMTDSIYSFSDLPIKLIVAAGVIATVTSIVVSLVLFISWLKHRIPVAGYTPIMLAILFFGGMSIFSVGIVGSYVARAFDNTKGRPNFIESSYEEFNPRR